MAGMSIEKLKRILRERSTPTNAETSLADRRGGMEASSFPVAPDIDVKPIEAAGLRAEWLRAPGAEEDRAILYLHGGGYIVGSIVTHRALAGEISRAAGAQVLLIDYRLAPEHPHPAAVEDAVAAYRFLLEQEPTRTAIAGDSAGGGLAVASLVALRERGLSLPDAAVCISPWSDLTCSAESYRTRADLDPMIQSAGIAEMANAYLQGTPAETPTASPNFADLEGLPPLLIHAGTDEVLHDDAVGLHERAKAAGVESTLEIWEGMIHVWHAFHPMLEEGERAIERVGAFLRETWSA